MNHTQDIVSSPKNSSRNTVSPSFAEELMNSVSHGIGTILSAAALVLLLLRSDDFSSALGSVLFGVSLIFLYLMSTLYHALPSGKVRDIFQQLDHAAIFILIAGSYSVFCLSIFSGRIGPWMFWSVWSLAAIGILGQILWGNAAHKISLVLYLLMGWLAISQYSIIAETLPSIPFGLLLAGGITYTVGFFFYAMQKFPWMHVIWHFFVLGGSICHVLCALQVL
ncbi:MAG: hemolysin III family protein [Thermoguttaceae bacterium]|nr:hemolysin III family protein [Thermoguttaceae bacterium]